MRYAMLVWTLLCAFSALGQTDPRWSLITKGTDIGPVRADMAIGPAEDVYEWATNYSISQERRREAAKRVGLLESEIEDCDDEVSALRLSRDSEKEARIAAEGGRTQALLDLNECRNASKWDWTSFSVGTGTGIAITVTSLIVLATQLR